MPPPDPQNEAFTRRAGVLLLAVLAAGVGLRLAVLHPLHNYLLDLRGYYAAGVAVGRGLDPYDRERVAAEVTMPGRQQLVQYFYPPPTLPAMALLSKVPFAAAQVAWCIFQFGCVLGALALVLRALRAPLGGPESVVIAAVTLLGIPIQELFRWGQIDGTVLLLVAAAFFALARGRAGRAGAALGAAAVLKLVPVLYLPVLLARRPDRRTAPRLCWRGLLTGTLVVAALMGAAACWRPELTGSWWSRLRAGGGAPGTIASPNNQSLGAFVHRALVGIPPDVPPALCRGPAPATARWVVPGLVGVVVFATLAWYLRNRRSVGPATLLAAVVPAVLMVWPVTWAHHQVVILLPAAVAVCTVCRAGATRGPDLAWLATALLLLTVWPVEQMDLHLAPTAALVCGPTPLYGVALLWLFLLVRYVPLVGGARAGSALRSLTLSAAPQTR